MYIDRQAGRDREEERRREREREREREMIAAKLRENREKKERNS